MVGGGGGGPGGRPGGIRGWPAVGRQVGVDATTLEANAAMKSIVRRDSGEDWKEYLKRLAEEAGVEINNDEDL